MIPAAAAVADVAAIAVSLSVPAGTDGGEHRFRRGANHLQPACQGGGTYPAAESAAVAQALASLHPDHRQVLVETYFRGSSVDKAAAMLGIPAGTVKSRTFYALKALKLALQERGLTF